MANLSNTIVAVKTIKGTSFVGVRGYKNKQGEVSNQTFVGGISLGNHLKRSLEKMTSMATMRQVVGLFADTDKDIVKKAYNELVASLVKRTSSEEEKAKLLAEGDKTIKRSVAMTNAFTHIAKGLKVHNESGDVHISGLFVRKTILVEGEYKQVKSNPKTIAKRRIEKLAYGKLKYKSFKIGNIETLKINGVTL
jgi:hypothetical protein